MLILLRIILGLALAYAIRLAHDHARGAGAAGLFDSLVYVGAVFFLALANAAVWAPFIGGRLADALSGDSAAAGNAPVRKKTRAAKIFSWFLRLGVVVALVGLGYWTWQYRAMFDPVRDLVNAWRMGHAPWSAPEMEFTVLKVVDAEKLQARDSAGSLFTIRLAGLEAPRDGVSPAAQRERAAAGREFLTSLVVSNQVEVEVTLTNESRVILGFVSVGGTNVNAACIAAGHAGFQPDALGKASLRSRWEMLQADRRARIQGNVEP